jgi:rhodanese-related sulfurtransferase
VLRPMSQVQQWQSEFQGKEVLLQCRSGARSQQVAQYLAGRGITAHNLAGGLMAWSAKQ